MEKVTEDFVRTNQLKACKFIKRSLFKIETQVAEAFYKLIRNQDVIQFTQLNNDMEAH